MAAALKKTASKKSTKTETAEKVSKPVKAKAAKFETMEITFRLRNETPGTFRFEEIDEKGNVISTNEGAAIGGLYLRKVSNHGEVSNPPKIIKVVVSAE